LIRVTASRANGWLTLGVYNDGPGLPSDWENSRSGIGITNLRNRLRAMFGEAFELSLRNEAAGVEVPHIRTFQGERKLNAPPRTGRIRTLVVDDEPLARSNLTVLLRHDPEIEIVGECGSGRKALAEIRRRKPDLIFLDVQMPEFDGFDLVEKLGKDLPPAVVFVTAYDQYALKAFEAGALDYLLKPFDDARFGRALSRAKEKNSAQHRISGQDRPFCDQGHGAGYVRKYLRR